jgi:uncharacterized protein involved in exopolysaccharide biosynthesis
MTDGENAPTASAAPTPLSSAPVSLPRIGVLESVRRYKLLAALPLIVLLAAALAYGAIVTPTYTAESFNSIGRLDVNEPGTLAGFQEATETLAITYARAVFASSVVNRVSDRLGMPVSEVRSKLRAYTVPESAVFVVTGSADSEDEAIAVSIEGAAALQRYIRQLNAENPNSDRLFREYRRAIAEIARVRGDLVALQRRFGDNPTASERAQLNRLETRFGTAQLERVVAQENYEDSQASQSAINVVQTLALPETAESDRWDRLQIALFIAVSAGILLGLALATYRANRDIRRVLSVS